MTELTSIMPTLLCASLSAVLGFWAGRKLVSTTRAHAELNKTASLVSSNGQQIVALVQHGIQAALQQNQIDLTNVILEMRKKVPEMQPGFNYDLTEITQNAEAVCQRMANHDEALARLVTDSQEDSLAVRKWIFGAQSQLQRLANGQGGKSSLLN